MFTGIYSTYLDSEGSDNEDCCCWKVIGPVGEISKQYKRKEMEQAG